MLTDQEYVLVRTDWHTREKKSLEAYFVQKDLADKIDKKYWKPMPEELLLWYVYLSDSDDKQTFKNTDKAIFNTYYTNTFLLTRQSSLISIIGYTVCLDKNDFLLAEYNSR